MPENLSEPACIAVCGVGLRDSSSGSYLAEGSKDSDSSGDSWFWSSLSDVVAYSLSLRKGVDGKVGGCTSIGVSPMEGRRPLEKPGVFAREPIA